MGSNQDIYIFDLRESDGYWEIGIRWYDVVKDILEASLYAIAGQEDGKYIFNYFTKGLTEDVEINKWLKAKGGTEFYIDTTQPSGVHIGDNANNPHTTDGVKIWDDIYPVQTTVDGRNLYLFLTRTPLDVDGPLMTLKLEDVF